MYLCALLQKIIHPAIDELLPTPKGRRQYEEATIAKIYESMIDFSSATLTEDKFDY